MPPTTGSRFGAGEQGPGLSVGTSLGRVEIEEGALYQSCRGLLQAGGKLKGCPVPSPRCGVDGWKGKGASVVLGEDTAAHEKRKGTVGRRWDRG